MSFQIQPYEYLKVFNVKESKELGTIVGNCGECGLWYGESEINQRCKRCGTKLTIGENNE